MPDILEQDPLIQAEERKYKLKLLRWNYYLNVTKNIGGILKIFKDEAISLVAGLITLVTGFFEIKKIIILNTHKTVENTPLLSSTFTGIRDVAPHWHFDSNTGLGAVSLFVLLLFSFRAWLKRREGRRKTDTGGSDGAI